MPSRPASPELLALIFEYSTTPAMLLSEFCDRYNEIVRRERLETTTKDTDDMTTEQETLDSTPAAQKALFKTVEVEHVGEKIILPERMTKQTGIEWLTRRMQEDEQEVMVDETIESFPLDGVIALMKALKEIYGFAQMVPVPGFFGSTPPAMIGVEIGVGESVQVPWGRMNVPDVSGYLQTAIGQTPDGRPVLRLVAKVKQKDKARVARIAQLTRDIVLRESIYRGKAFEMLFPDPETAEEWDLTKHMPRFLDVSGVREDELMFPADTQTQITNSLFTPIEFTATCREHRVPLKRGVLLEGPYGTGKTLTAYVTAKKAQANGWTYIYLKNVQALEAALRFAKQYQPAVIFAEDIDQVLGTQDRDEDVNGILNTIDGVVSKNSEIVVVLTTNHVERINQAMLRPGRLDAVVSVRPPDAETVRRLIRLYARGLLAPNQTLRAVGELMDGRQPAMIREVVERAKLAAIARGAAHFELVDADLDTAAQSMLAHLELLKPRLVDSRSGVERAAQTMADTLIKLADKQPASNGKALRTAQLPPDVLPVTGD